MEDDPYRCDEQVLAELRALIGAVDRPPPRLPAVARGLFALRDLDEALARLRR